MPRQTFPKSSAILATSYEQDTQQLIVTFKNGRNYTYNDVPPEVYDQFTQADSPGSFWRNQINGQYS